MKLRDLKIYNLTKKGNYIIFSNQTEKLILK